jgi:redox-sensitive bicupin YhaK (pirin superfamily)
LIEDGGVRARVIAGSDFGVKSPVGMLSEWLYAEVVLAAGATAPLDPDQEERAISTVRLTSRARHSKALGFWSSVRATGSRY